MTDSVPNPYQAPQSEPDDPSLSRVERTRLAHLGHEAAIRWCSEQIGWVALVLILAGIVTYEMHTWNPAFRVPWGIGLGGSGVCLMWVHIGLNRLDTTVRTPAMIVAGVMLLAFPLGTALGSYLLYLLSSEKGKYVLSPAYHHVYEATPHIRHQTTLFEWLYRVGLLAALGAIAGALWWRR
jgi:hypothetical protein